MSLQSRLQRIERKAPRQTASDYTPMTPEECEEAYQEMLQAFSRGEFERYPGSLPCWVAMRTNRLPVDFERDVRNICGEEGYRKFFCKSDANA